MQPFHYSNKLEVDLPGPAISWEKATAEIDDYRVVRYRYQLIPGNDSSVRLRQGGSKKTMYRDRIVSFVVMLLTTSILFLGLNSLILEVSADPDCSDPLVWIDRYDKHGIDIRFREWWHSHPLTDAARSGDLRLIKWLLHQGVDINATEPSGWTALMAAAYAGNVQATKLLVEQGADIDAVNKSARTALDLTHGPRLRQIQEILKRGRESLTGNGATKHSDFDTLQRSPDRDVGVSEARRKQDSASDGLAPPARDPRIDTLLQSADNRRIEIHWLEWYGCSYQPDVDNEDLPPLIEAATRGDLQQVRTLVAQGADVNEEMNCGLTPLITAAQNGHADVVEYLLSIGADVNAANCRRGSPLIVAACGAHPDIMRILINLGADVNEARAVGYTGARLEKLPLTIPFELAAAMGDVDLVKLMLDKGVPIPVLGKDALMVALRNGRTGVVKLLEGRGIRATLSDLANLGLTKMIRRRLEAGADVNESNEFGETALMSAAEKGNVKLLELLLDKGADITAQGLPALWRAARRGRLKTVRFLLHRGVDVSKKRGGPDLVAVVHNRHMDVLEVLLANGADANAHGSYGPTALTEATERDLVNIVKLLLDHGADPNLSDGLGRTAVWVALTERDGSSLEGWKEANYDIAALLWKHGARFDLKEVNSRIGLTEREEGYYLFGAIHGDSIDALRQLLDLGSDVNTRYGRLNQTPLMAAVEEGKTEMVKLLLERGAEVNVTDLAGITPLERAQNRGFKDIIKLLVEHGASTVVEEKPRE